MSPSRSFRRVAAGLFILLAAIAGPLHGQEIAQLHTDSLTAMRQGKWALALSLLEKAVKQYDAQAPTLFGPKFGWFWYHKGYSELKVKKYEDAMKSFETCYKKYPNNKGAAAGAGDDQSINLYHVRSLLKWGEAAQGAEDYETAIRMYKKFIDERDPTRDKYERGAFYINMAICHFKIDKLSTGIENLETAIKNKEEFPTPDEGIMAGFQGLVQAVINKKDEQAFIDFINKNRADIVLEPFQMHPFVPIFLKLAADALGNGLDRTAFELYALVPSTKAILDDMQAQLAMIGRLERPFNDGSRLMDKSGIEKHMEESRGAARGGDPAEVIALGATAYIHEENGNARGAFAAYEQLEWFYDKSKKREDHLYNLVRTSSIIGEVLTTEKYGTVFLGAFPNSKYAESVRSMMLTSLFFGGEYDECILVAGRMIDTLPKPSDQHDICLHVLGGSYYYTGQYDVAKEHLKAHPEQYPESQFKMAALYFEGSNLSRLQYWSAAAKLLDTFLEKYPDPRENIYLSYALYDRSNCHYAEDELEPALAKVNRLETEFPGADVMDMAFNLKGNILQTLNEFDEAERYYLKALEIAERRENRIVASEALYYLVGVLGAEKRGREENPRVGDAVPYYDKFWSEYGSDSPYKAQVAVSGVHALTKAGRAEEALERLQGVIAELASVSGAPGLEEAINSYTRAYLEIHSPEELKEHYYQFPGIDSENREAQALLRIAIIGVFETILEQAGKEQEESVALKSNAMIKVLFQDLKNYFKPKDLSNYVLVRLGDYLRENTSAPRQALPYYEEVVTREDQSYRFPALFGIADVYGASENTNENAKAIQSLERIFTDATDKAEKERSLFRIVTILAKSREWSKVTSRSKEYLTTAGFKKFAPQASLLLAESYERQDMDEDAIAAYTKTWAAYTGYILVSAPAVKRIIELTWERDRGAQGDQKPDRQTAYEFGWNYLDSTSRLVSQMTPEERDLRAEVEVLVQQYEDDPTVMKMEDVKKLQEQSR